MPAASIFKEAGLNGVKENIAQRNVYRKAIMIEMHNVYPLRDSADDSIVVP
jgi:hypothetical protein